MSVQCGGLTVTYGWDAPLQYFYLTVQEGGRMVYSNLDDPRATSGTYGGGLTLDGVQARLAAFGAPVTAGQLRALVRPPSPRPAVLSDLLSSLSEPLAPTGRASGDA